MVSADSPASEYVVKRSDCNIRIKGSCGMSSANTKGTLQFGIRNDRNQIVPVSLEVLLVRDLGANIFSVGALKEKGVLCDLMFTPPALRCGTHVFPVSTEIPRMYVVNIILDGASLDESAQVLSTKLDAHLWHRRMGQQPACSSTASGQRPFRHQLQPKHRVWRMRGMCRREQPEDQPSRRQSCPRSNSS